jgi:hypothetical protein
LWRQPWAGARASRGQNVEIISWLSVEFALKSHWRAAGERGGRRHYRLPTKRQTRYLEPSRADFRCASRPHLGGAKLLCMCKQT